MYKIAMPFCIAFFNIFAMQQYSEQDHVDFVLKKLVEPGKGDSIIIVPIKINDSINEKNKRKQSENRLLDSAEKAVTHCFVLASNATAGKTFLIMDNCVANYREKPTSIEGCLYKMPKLKINKHKIKSTDTQSYQSSFIVYNMPYYNQDEYSFYWAYGEDLQDHLYWRKEPCLILIDEDVYSKDAMAEIYKIFHGKKRIFEYEKNFKNLKEYQSSFLNEIPLPIIAFWAGVVVVGLFYCMPSDLIESLNTVFNI